MFCSQHQSPHCCLHAGNHTQRIQAYRGVLVPYLQGRVSKALSPGLILCVLTSVGIFVLTRGRADFLNTPRWCLLCFFAWNDARACQRAWSEASAASSMGTGTLLAGEPGGTRGGVWSWHRLDLVNQIIWKRFSRAYPCRLLLNPKVSA